MGSEVHRSTLTQKPSRNETPRRSAELGHFTGDKPWCRYYALFEKPSRVTATGVNQRPVAVVPRSKGVASVAVN